MSILGPGHCDTCRWWGGERAHDESMPLGTCRVNPPSVGRQQVLAYHDPDRPEEPGPLISRGEWHWTAFDDGCGSHVEKIKTIGL
jgi:hypothetical protein